MTILYDLRALLILLDLKLTDMIGVLRGLSLARIFGTLVSVVIAATIAFLIYRFDLYVFDYLMGIPDLGRLVIARFFELAFLLFFLALMISTALTALSMLYNEGELSLLLTLPVSYGAIFTAKYFEVILYSSWALIALMVPFVLSYAVYFDVDWPVYMTLFGGLMLPLVLISGSVGVVVALLLRWVLGGIPRRKLFTWGIVFLLIMVLAGALLISSNQSATQKGLGYLLSLVETGQANDPSLLPHKLITRGFLSILEARWDLLQRVVLTLVGLAALIVLLTLDMGRAVYYRSWLAGADHAPSRTPSLQAKRLNFGFLTRWISPIYRAFLRKDLLEFRRYPLQWGQAFLLLGFWAIYIINIIHLPGFFDLNSSFWQILLFYANFCFSCYFAAALAGRFVYPVVSLEGQGFWLIKAAPVSMEVFLWSKFWQSFIPLFILTGSMLTIGNWVLHIHPALFQASLICVFFATFSLTALALGLGALFADFTASNPMRIANTPGGILCIFISLVFMVLMTTIFGWPTYLTYKASTFTALFPLSEWTTAVILFIAFSILGTLIPLMIGLKALNRDLKV
ncbi:hypothetical protein KKA00_09155 [bacterium]|nr:hypothetical protein [bacterium]MBU1880406.1 hypothetical protein [bacterium]